MSRKKNKYGHWLSRSASLMAMVVVLICQACGKDDAESTLPNDRWYDIVTLADVSSSGSTFTLQKDGDSDVITYTSKYTFPNDTAVYAGRRLLIMYLREGEAPAYTTGPISLYGYRTLDNWPQEVVSEHYSGSSLASTDCLEVQSLTRTGVYVNLQARLSCFKAQGAKRLCLMADPSTLTEAVPQLYVVYQALSPGENFMTGYASWDISQVWNLPTCQGVNIKHLSKTGVREQSFLK